MCELFAVSSPDKIKLNDLLKEFFSHGVYHPHGWGLAFFYDNAMSLEKEPVLSCNSAYLKQRLNTDIIADQMIAHIRQATRGSMIYENTHPFVQRDNYNRIWTLAHNGTIFESDVLDSYMDVEKGNTDSERILCYILDCINREQSKQGRALTGRERFRLLDQIILEITPGNKVNLLIFDGELLYVHTNLKDSLHYIRKDNSLIFATTALDQRHWNDLPMQTLFAFERGHLKYKGTKHDNEYFPY